MGKIIIIIVILIVIVIKMKFLSGPSNNLLDRLPDYKKRIDSEPKNKGKTARNQRNFIRSALDAYFNSLLHSFLGYKPR